MVGSGAVSATTLLFSVAGQFSSSVTASPLAAPNAPWRLSFTVDSNPSAGNIDQLGFDTPFSNFSYLLNNSSVAAAPSIIRFFTTGNLGMFTVFFGPESGYSNNVPIPEFSFLGAQLFSGATASPILTAGVYPVSEFIYSDAVNYDDHLPANISLSVTAVPEPSPLTILLFGLVLIAFSQTYRVWKQR